jgi:hypothetical protein
VIDRQCERLDAGSIDISLPLVALDELVQLLLSNAEKSIRDRIQSKRIGVVLPENFLSIGRPLWTTFMFSCHTSCSEEGESLFSGTFPSTYIQYLLVLLFHCFCFCPAMLMR